MIDADKRQAVFLLHQEGMGRNQIARQLRISRNTVHLIIEQKGQMPVRTRKDKIQVDPDLVQRLYQECEGYAQRVHEKLVEDEHIQIQYSTLTRLLRELGLRRSREPRCQRVPDELGAEMQHDKSDIVRSITAAQDWLNYLVYGSSASTLFSTVVGGPEDLAALLYHLRNGKVRQRKQAATILARTRGIPNAIVSIILHSSPKTTRRYFNLYKEAGASALFATGTRCPGTQVEDPAKTRDLLEILHQKPTSFGINRTSWTQRTLIQAYKDTYKKSISRGTVKRLIKNAGYGWRRARRVLTSPDPAYRDKVELLSKTLRSLAPTELLFFLDEWGPVQVKKRGGKTYSAKDNSQQFHDTKRHGEPWRLLPASVQQQTN
jgi:transposase